MISKYYVKETVQDHTGYFPQESRLTPRLEGSIQAENLQKGEKIRSIIVEI